MKPTTAEVVKLLRRTALFVGAMADHAADYSPTREAGLSLKDGLRGTADALEAEPDVPTILTHGLNRDCPKVQDGTWTRCLGHGHRLPDPKHAGVAAVALASAEPFGAKVTAAEVAYRDSMGNASVGGMNHRRAMEAALRAAGVEG